MVSLDFITRYVNFIEHDQRLTADERTSMITNLVLTVAPPETTSQEAQFPGEQFPPPPKTQPAVDGGEFKFHPDFLNTADKVSFEKLQRNGKEGELMRHHD